ncbi:hypothetical protein [Arsukibacterium sp.]|uniref:hypothetical protein n=1 Tax=Arsukibacterium sp. TaxID=1977258 RepID=UPI00299F2B7B|nr:hypothetical protein [Arsukibacterium sp.]MDX1676545.1 hypothetical protein [Arsukibacterium sp.]
MNKVMLLMLLFPGLLPAATLVMHQQVDNTQRRFSYQLLTAEQQFRFAFSLQSASIVRNANLVQRYVPGVLRQQLEQQLQQQTRQAGPYRVVPGPGQDWLNFELTHAYPAGSPEAQLAEAQRLQLLKQLQRLSQQFQQQYLDTTGYQQLSLPDNRQLIIVDHQKIVEQSLADIAPLAQALVSQLELSDQRQLISVLLSWIQLIPLHPAEQAEYGASYTPPLQLLRQHQGDSASKTVLLATLLKIILPKVRQAILYLPERTMLALAIPAGPEDLTVSLQNIDYLVADPSGPELIRLGKVAKLQEVFIRNQFFDFRQF